MFLLGKKIKGISITHPLGNDLPEQMTDERKNELIAKLLTGDLSAVEALVRGHLRLAIHIAGQYAINAKNKAHDLVSEAILAVVMACHVIAANQLPPDTNYPGYIIVRIHSCLSRYLEKDHLIPVPRATVRLAKKSGQTLKIPTREHSEFDKEYSHLTTFEIKDVLDQVIKNDLERQIIKLRSQSMVDREIADVLKISISKIAAIRAAVEERFEQELLE